MYQKFLEKFDYSQTLKYHPANKSASNSKRNRKQNVILFNPPFSINVRTEVQNYYLLNFIRKRFLSCHKFSK